MAAGAGTTAVGRTGLAGKGGLVQGTRDAQGESELRVSAANSGCSSSSVRRLVSWAAASLFLPLQQLLQLLLQREERGGQQPVKQWVCRPGGGSCGKCSTSSSPSILLDSLVIGFVRAHGVLQQVHRRAPCSPEVSRLGAGPYRAQGCSPLCSSTTTGSRTAMAAAVPMALPTGTQVTAAAGHGAYGRLSVPPRQEQQQRYVFRKRLLLLSSAVTALLHYSSGSWKMMSLRGVAASAVALSGDTVAAAATEAAVLTGSCSCGPPLSVNPRLTAAAAFSVPQVAAPPSPPGLDDEDCHTLVCPCAVPTLSLVEAGPSTRFGSDASSSISCVDIAHQEEHSLLADAPPPLPLTSHPCAAVVSSSRPHTGVQGTSAAAATAPPAARRTIDDAAGPLFRRAPAATAAVRTTLNPPLSYYFIAPTSSRAGSAASFSPELASPAVVAVQNFPRTTKPGIARASPAPVESNSRQRRQSLLSVPLPAQSLKAATAATPATTPPVWIPAAVPVPSPPALGVSFIPPTTALFSRNSSRLSSAATLLLHARKIQQSRRRGATTIPGATRTLTAGAAPAAHSSSSTPLHLAANSWLPSLSSPLRFSPSPLPTARQEKQRNRSFSSSAAALGSARVCPSAAAASPPPATRNTVAAAPGAQSSSRRAAAAPGATFFPVCRGCSSLIPSFTMAAAASVDSATAADKQQPGETEQVAQKVAKRPAEKHRLDYKPPDFNIDNVDLVFDLDEERTRVTSTLTLRRRADTEPTDLVLDGEDLSLQRVFLDGEELTDGMRGSRSRAGAAGGEEEERQQKHQAVDSDRVYTINPEGKLVIPKDLLPPDSNTKFSLMTELYVNPKANLQLSGLYKSGRFLVTQCEAEGFRRITYFIDRPDVMAFYKVKLIADKKTSPTLLSNGNQIEAGDVEGDPTKHYAVFEDPFRKPCYLFALVAGELVSIKRTFTTFRGRNVSVRMFSEPQESHKLDWAMESLLKAMKWDEERFGLEYDLDIFNVVCADAFNMGAMENKSLNVFNTSALLAHPKTSTDANYEHILSVVGHEYFHNWTGNRVTCRDWFQLTLKEGLTVFREQLFTADMFSAAVKRIEDVRGLRSRQFVEDSGPMAHPIRPEAYVAIDNFYTATVYQKGAEVIRMYHTLLGEGGFRRGMDLYFKRHDGHAVTCDDFRMAMADANNKDLTQFELWYSQAGTPQLDVVEATWLGPRENAFKLTVKQSTPPTPKQPTKLPLHIPIKFGLIGKQSKVDILHPATQVLELTSEQQTFVIAGVNEDCVLSFLRDFSAPVKVKYPSQTDEDLAFLMGFDSDGFSRWQAAYTLASKLVGQRAVLKRDNKDLKDFPPLPQIYVDAFKSTLLATGEDKSLQAYTLRLPSFDELAQEMDPIDPDALQAAIQSVRKEIDKLLHDEMLEVYESLAPPSSEKEETRDQEAVGRRRFRGVLLYFLTSEKDAAAAKLAMRHFTEAKGMTGRFGSLVTLVDFEQPEKQEALDIFYREAEGDPLVLNKWFAAQALSDCPDTIEVVRKLLSHPDFKWTNPNRFRALVSTFSHGTQFHNLNGEGYTLVTDCVLKVDQFNPQLAAHAAGAFVQWRRYDRRRQQLMLEQLRRVRDTPTLSTDTREIVDKALADDPALRRGEAPEDRQEA